ncbi:MAG: exodeoxyribonuclease III [Acidimicrobiia bacterium]
MKLFSWNVNGIRAVLNKGLFMPFVEKYDPDVLCLQETKAQRDQVEIDLKDYFEYWNSAQKKGYSGTAIFTKKEPISVINDFPSSIIKKYDLKDNYGDTNSEGRVLTLEFKDYFVSTVYTPNSKSDLTRLSLRELYWDVAYLEYMIELEKKKPVLFCGDLNVAHQEIDLAQPKQNRGKHGFTDQEREGFNKILEAGFIDSFRHFYPETTGMYSWWSNFAKSRERNVGWRIDYWLVSKSLKNKIANPEIHMDVMGSDHCPISIELK